MSEENHMKSSVAVLTLGALGVVFGDIGTSPLYAFKQAFASGATVSQPLVYGVISLIFWSMIFLLCLKYTMFIMKNDNEGEGGSMALTALVVKNLPTKSYSRKIAVLLGITATALFFGDGAITPAISVLSAIEGLEVASPAFKPYVIPISLVILCFLFFNLLILNGVAYSKTCDIQEKDLIGYWQVRKQTQSNFEEMEFNIIDNKKIFNSWLHHRPENIEGTWKINNCELVITSGLKYDFKIIKLNNKILEIQENNETYIEKYKKTER